MKKIIATDNQVVMSSPKVELDIVKRNGIAQ